MDGIRATPMQYPILGLLADRLKKAQQFAVAPGGYANPPAEILLNLLGVPAIQQTMERVAYGEPLTTGRGMTTQIRPEVAEAAMTLLPAAAGTARVAERGAMAAGRAGERMAERVVPQIMERGGMPAGLLEGMSSRTVSPLTVYHGSPAKFERFDPTKIGSGEGAQAYGYGHYLAESPETADYYAKTLANQHGRKLVDKTGKELSFNNPDTEGLAEVYLRGSSGYEDAKKQLQALADSSPEYASEYKKAIEKLDDWKSQGIKIGYEKDPNVYTIDLPDEQIARMLDWDKPLGKQSPEVRKAIEATKKMLPKNAIDDLGGDLSIMYGKDVTPEQFLNTWESLGVKAGGESALQKLGVPGVRYLDQGSRGAGEGTSNFVVFPGNEGLLTIQKRNNEVITPTSLLDKSPQSEALLTAQRNASKPIEEGGLGLPPNNTAMDRAKAMGFDVDLLHGTDKNLTKFEAQRSITKDHGWYGDEGVYLTPDPNTASGYANWRNVGSGPGGKLGQELYGQNVMPLMVRRGNVFDYGDAPPIMDREKAKEFSEIVKRLGYNTVEVPNKYAAPEYSKNYETVVIDPSRIRSRFAAFDPARIDENDLLAGVLPLSLLADEEQRKKADAYFRSLLGQ